MTRLFKSIISTLVAIALVAVLPAETTVNADQVEFAVEQESNEVFASADVKIYLHNYFFSFYIFFYCPRCRYNFSR